MDRPVYFLSHIFDFRCWFKSLPLLCELAVVHGRVNGGRANCLNGCTVGDVTLGTDWTWILTQLWELYRKHTQPVVTWWCEQATYHKARHPRHFRCGCQVSQIYAQKKKDEDKWKNRWCTRIHWLLGLD